MSDQRIYAALGSVVKFSWEKSVRRPLRFAKALKMWGTDRLRVARYSESPQPEFLEYLEDLSIVENAQISCGNWLQSLDRDASEISDEELRNRHYQLEEWRRVIGGTSDDYLALSWSREERLKLNSGGNGR